MLELSFATLTYYFSCHFLWVSLSLFLYLDEEVSIENIGVLGMKWGKLSEDLANWTIKECHYLLNNTGIAQQDQDVMSLTAGRLGDLLMFYFANALDGIVDDSHAKESIFLSESEWLYYYYCGFLLQVFKMFDQLMQELNRSSVYYERYQKSITLFQDLGVVIEKEYFSLKRLNEIDGGTVQTIWAEIDTDVIKLGMEWNQAVLEAAHSQTLPKFIGNDL